MATKHKTSKPVGIKSRKTRASRHAAQTGPASNARKVLLAGMGAATRVQNEAVRVYGLIATEAKRLSAMTGEAAENLAHKASALVREGQQQQSQGISRAQSKAADVAKEVKAFAKKSEELMKKNIGATIASTMASGRAGVTQLEDVFEARVAKTLNTFGIPSGKDVRELQARMADLQKALNQLNKRRVRV